MLEVALAVVLGAWFILTIIHQFEALPSFVAQEFSPWSIIPTWRFFAPNPSKWDYYLFYRDREENEKLTPFHHIPLARDRTPRHVFWNPQKRCTKVFSDSIRALDAAYRARENEEGEIEDEEEILERAFPYMVLLNRALDIPTPTGETYRQVLVVRRSYQEDKPELTPVLLSDFYQVPTAARVEKPNSQLTTE
jgi:hypothetical protein